ncbi:uncharacterized protein ATNIH1004_002065 [Aspergillus tanneri]|uniref:Uncharacterized protein n=1 Tax=Aspergillus tanneri TaxID=1220188 RepID=A0A5M9M7G4_9EURO|nr:uncharacterized protein ATNIH1004_002065 [Aspergillus tanneri]KAA8641264.1 hypothetical protein ATNIH1004_002065 [Aspergillus tanneri]
MKLLDSVIKETQLKPGALVNLERKTINKVTLSRTVWFFPAAPASPVECTTWSNRDVSLSWEGTMDIDFLKCESRGSDTAVLSSTSPKHVAFGIGRSCCRKFLAANLGSIVVAKILLDYDIRLEEGIYVKYPRARSTQNQKRPARNSGQNNQLALDRVIPLIINHLQPHVQSSATFIFSAPSVVQNQPEQSSTKNCCMVTGSGGNMTMDATTKGRVEDTCHLWTTAEVFADLTDELVNWFLCVYKKDLGDSYQEYNVEKEATRAFAML